MGFELSRGGTAMGIEAIEEYRRQLAEDPEAL
jgi:hypothetical protein